VYTTVCVVLLMLMGAFFLDKSHATHRWIKFGPVGIQPSELAKLAAIFFIAALLERRMHRINEIKYALAPIGLLVFALFTLIILEPDFGTSMSLVLIAMAMVFAAGLNYSYILGAALCARESGAVVTDAAGRTLDDRPLLGGGVEFQMSVVCSSGPALHARLIAEIDRGIDRLREARARSGP